MFIRCAVFSSWLWAWAVFGQAPVTLSIDTSYRGSSIPDDYAGLGFETWAEKPDVSGVSGHFFSPTNSQLITLFTNCGVHNLRIGGGTVDGLRAARPDHADIDNVFEFARAAGVKVIYSFGLLNGDPSADAGAAKYIWEHYRPDLDYFAIGNEPDVKSYVYPPFGKGTDPAITNFDSYLDKWRRFASAVTNAVPGVKFAGPDAAGQYRAPLFVSNEMQSGLIALVTQHDYIGGRPFITGKNTNMPATVAIDHMLSVAWVTNHYPAYYKRAVVPIEAAGLPWRLTEANDYLHGVTNASDAFASALWALDYLHWWAVHGCAGVNFHNNQRSEWLRTDTIYLDKGQYRINPKAYAIKAFDLGSHGWEAPLDMSNADQLDLTAYAVENVTNLYVTIINKEHGPGARAALVTIRTGQFAAKNAAMMVLRARNGNAGATNGIALGGALITNHTPWKGHWKRLKRTSNGWRTVVVKATSAVVVKLSEE